MYCSNCGKEIDENARFCPECGNAVGMTQSDNERQAPAGENEVRYQEPPIVENKKTKRFSLNKIVIAVVLLILVIGGGIGYRFISRNNEFKDVMNRAEYYSENSDYDQAIDYYNKALKIKNGNKKALDGILQVRNAQFEECRTQVNDAISQGDYNQAQEKLEELSISKDDSCYPEYQELLTIIKMSPKITEIDATAFPSVKVTVRYDGDFKLADNSVTITEDGEDRDIETKEMLGGQAVITFRAEGVDYESESRDISVKIAKSGIVLTTEDSYDTPKIEQADMTLVTTDLSEYPLVKAYFRVNSSDTGERVDNLNANSFTIQECIEGGEYLSREIHSVNLIKGNAGINIDLVADKSDSIIDSMDDIKQVMTEFVQNLQFATGDKAEVIAFDDIVQQMCTYTNKPELLVNGINNMSPDGFTAFYDALYTGIRNATLQGGARCVIAFTDGVDNRSLLNKPEDVIEYANANQVPLYIIGVGAVNEDVLKNIAHSTNGEYWYINDLYDLQDIFNTIYEQQQDMYEVTYESDSAKDAYSSRTLEITLEGNGYKGECNSSFTPSKTIHDNTGTGEHKSRYELFTDDISWTDAQQKCEEMGGHLVTITSPDEMNQMIDLAKQKKVSYVWIGGYTSYTAEDVPVPNWITGEPFDYEAWSDGEPSNADLDGTQERYLMLWNVKSLGGWGWNDQRVDPAKDFSYFRGHLAYICEFEN